MLDYLMKGLMFGLGACIALYLFTYILDVIQWFDDRLHKRHQERQEGDMLRRY